MLIQIPYSLDELLATLQFMRRRLKAGRSCACFCSERPTRGGRTQSQTSSPLVGMSSSARCGSAGSAYPGTLRRRPCGGGADGTVAAAHAADTRRRRRHGNADHEIRALALTVISLAAAEMARPQRFLLIRLVAPRGCHRSFMKPTMQAIVASQTDSIAISLCRGAIRERYGKCRKVIVSSDGARDDDTGFGRPRFGNVPAPPIVSSPPTHQGDDP